MTKAKPKKTARAATVDARAALDKMLGGRPSFGEHLRAIREGDELTLDVFAQKIGITRGNLCDVEQGRKAVSPERADRWAKALGYSPAVFVMMALQDTLDRAGVEFEVEVRAPSSAGGTRQSEVNAAGKPWDSAEVEKLLRLQLGELAARWQFRSAVAAGDDRALAMSRILVALEVAYESDSKWLGKADSLATKFLVERGKHNPRSARHTFVEELLHAVDSWIYWQHDGSARPLQPDKLAGLFIVRVLMEHSPFAHELRALEEEQARCAIQSAVAKRFAQIRDAARSHDVAVRRKTMAEDLVRGGLAAMGLEAAKVKDACKFLEQRELRAVKT